MAEVGWSDAAIADVEEIRSYIAAEHPFAAERVVQILVGAGESLASLPFRGRTVEGGRRKLIVAPYVIFYRVTGDREQVIISAVFDGRRII